MKCNYQTPIKEETETFHEEIIEPLELLPEQQIYNPIIDEFPPTNPHYLDFEQYIAVKRVIPKEWSLTGLNIPIKNNNINNKENYLRLSFFIFLPFFGTVCLLS
jgi:hypothetical protein